MAKKPDIIDPIDASFDDLVDAVVPRTSRAAPTISSDNSRLSGNRPIGAASSIQLRLDLGIQVEKQIDGIEMGVLQNGMPYLTQAGLSRMSGAARATIFEITQEWEQTYSDVIAPKGRMAYFKDYLFKQGYDSAQLFVEILKNGSPYYAYPDVVCMAFVEYFAFEAQRTNPTAIKNFRNLARYGMQQFIYTALDYTPEDKWKYFNDRVSLLKDASPDGYFIVFSEITGVAVDLINAGLSVNDKTIPDISVGIHWGKFWSDNNLDARFGNRIKWDHYYPGYYAQSTSNPQHPWAYPDAALPLFRRWLRHQYLPTKFPAYILKKANVLSGGVQEAALIAGIYDKKLLED